MKNATPSGQFHHAEDLELVFWHPKGRFKPDFAGLFKTIFLISMY